MKRPRAAGAATPEAVPSPRVLVVDDEASITDLVATVLRYEGFRSAAGSATTTRRSDPSHPPRA
jgi:CheY-like chemotaxis protein